MVGAVLLLCLPAAWGTSRLKLRTDWTELLPESKRSITDLRRIQQRVGSSGRFVVVLEGDDTAALKRLVDDLAPRLEQLPPELVRWVEKDVRDERAFFEANRYLYAELADLEEVRDKLRARVGEARAGAVLDLGLEEEDDGEPAAAAGPDGAADLDLDAIRERYRARLAAFDRFPEGYFIGEDGRLAFLTVRTAFSGSSQAAIERLRARVEALLGELEPARYHPSIRASFTGDVLIAREEHEAVRNELLVVTVLCVTLILASIYLFFFDARAILVLGLGVLAGSLWTFGLTWLRIGYLTSATAFLASIIPGNGINSGIMLIARYLEERRAGAPPVEASARATRSTWAATLVAALAASIAYGALRFTDFRGFSDFGFIGGIGLLATWVTNYLLVPPLLLLTERTGRVVPRERRGGYGRPFLWLSERAPRAVLAGGIGLALLGFVLGYGWLSGDPFEYDFRRLRSERSRVTGAAALQRRVNAVLKGRPREGMVILADRPEQVLLLEQALERVREGHRGSGFPPVGEVRSVHDLVPPDQERKLELLREIRELALQVLPRLAPEKRSEVEELLPPPGLRPVALADLPPPLLRQFTEKDGRVGLMMSVALPHGVSEWEGKPLLRFAAAVREVRLPSGEIVHSSGRSVIFADMIAAILEDGPRLTLLSLAGVAILVVVTFRNAGRVALILLSLLVGVGWMFGVLALSGMRLNFLNFVAIPITFGIGVDYAVNMVRRYAEDGWEAKDTVLLETGGAVVLCSMTTIWGYLSLLYSDNQALRSFGKLAVLGEFACLAAGVAIVPSLATVVVERARRRRAGRSAAGAGAQAPGDARGADA